MLSQKVWLQLCRQLDLSKQAQQIAEEIRFSPPTRRVQSRAGNVSVRYPSQKMGSIIQAESHRNELAGIYEKEYDSDVLEYYDQPPRIQLKYLTKKGRRVGVRHTPDFFVIRTDSLGWEEWKMETELLRLAEKMPNRYIREKSNWYCPPGEEYATQFGFFYRVRSSAEIDWVFQRNLVFLEDYLRTEDSAVPPEITHAICSLVTEQPGITLQEIFLAIGETPTDVLYTLIAQGQVYIDFRMAPLVEPARVHVFRDHETAKGYTAPTKSISSSGDHSPFVKIEHGTSVVWDECHWTIINLGAKKITLLANDGTLISLPNATFENLIQTGQLTNPLEQTSSETHSTVLDLLARASPIDFETANRRYTVIAPILTGGPATEQDTPASTVRYWVSKWRKAEARYRCGYVGLLPQHWAKGNRKRKLPEATLYALETFIINDYETLKQKTKSAVYGSLIRECETQGLTAPSYKTFIQAIANRPRHEQIYKRKGRRAAYDSEPFYRELTLTTPRHGDRPFEIGHIDHTQLDIELVCSHTGRRLGRPWSTFLSDAFSRRLLAVYLAFDPPSYRACMMVLRECVRKHNRLPQMIVVDGGREFECVYFETLLARYECSKKTRPGAKPRFGSVCERLFGTTNTRFLYNLLGNTQMTRNVRQVTKAVAPKEKACWTLDRLYIRLCEWAYDVYDTIEHPALGQSPRESFAMGLAQGGQRWQRLISYDESFCMLTLPTTRKGTAKVIPSRGVKINYLYYWSDFFLDPQVENTQVPVRYDPYDAGVAYAFVKGRWVSCISEHYAHFAGRSEREIHIATAELRKRNQRHGQQFSITARKLADFLASLEAEELLLEQRLRDAEAKKTSSLLASNPSAKKLGSHPKNEDHQQSEGQKTSDAGEALDLYEDY